MTSGKYAKVKSGTEPPWNKGGKGNGKHGEPTTPRKNAIGAVGKGIFDQSASQILT